MHVMSVGARLLSLILITKYFRYYTLGECEKNSEYAEKMKKHLIMEDINISESSIMDNILTILKEKYLTIIFYFYLFFIIYIIVLKTQWHYLNWIKDENINIKKFKIICWICIKI